MKRQSNPPSDHRAPRPTRVIRSMVAWLVDSDRQFREMQSLVDRDRSF